jgi:hypothetical protein
MRKLAALLGLLVLAFACGGGDTLPTAPSTVLSPGDPAPPPSTPTGPGRVISVGEQVNGTLTAHGASMLFDLTAPSDSTLVVRLNWDPRQGSLVLQLEDQVLSAVPPDRSSIVGRLPVTAGRNYRLRVADFAAWDYDDLFLPFVLTTTLE